MHPRLHRQIRQHFGEAPPPELEAFLEAVGATYARYDEALAHPHRAPDASTGAGTPCEQSQQALTLHKLTETVEALGLQLGTDAGGDDGLPRPDADGAVRATDLLAVADLLAEQVRLRNEAEENLRAREARLRILMHQASDAIFVCDGETGRILDANQAAQHLTGYTLAELRAKHHTEMHPERLREQHDAAFRRIVEQERYAEGASWVLHRDGHEIPVDATSTVTVVDGRPLVQGIVRDATERRRHEEALVEARDAAEAASRLKSSFLANMSHELRTPLTAIIGFAEVLGLSLADSSDGEMAEYAELISKGGERLLETLNSVLEFARLEAERHPLLPESFDLRERLRVTARLFEPQAREKGVRLRVEVPRPGGVSLDPMAFDRIVTNLLSNAVKFTDEGEVRVRVDVKREEVRLVVEDTGTGMSADFQARLFDEFEQESKGVSRKHEGSGLGLAITKRLVELMGGEIAVTSDVGRGTRFAVTLPRYLDASLARAPLARLEEGPDGEGAPPPEYRVLLADAEPSTAVLVEHLLPETYLLTAVHPSEAGSALGEGPDVFLFAPPSAEAAERVGAVLRQMEDAPAAILLSAETPSLAEPYLSFGYDAILYRPFTRADLLDVLEAERFALAVRI